MDSRHCPSTGNVRERNTHIQVDPEDRYQSVHQMREAICPRHHFILLTQNPVYQTDKQSRQQPLPKPATQNAMGRLINTIERHALNGDKFAIRDLALFRLAYDTGCRASELSRMEIDDLNYGSVFVRNAKGQKDHSVFLAHKAAEALMDWLVIHPGCEWLFPNRYRAKPYTARGKKVVGPSRDQKEDRPPGPPQLRHAFPPLGHRSGPYSAPTGP